MMDNRLPRLCRAVSCISWRTCVAHLLRGAARRYDLRHAAVSLWLNAGVPAPTVARRAGHSVEVLRV